MTGTTDFYAVLGVPHHADDAALKRAYRQKALEHHPDRNPGEETSAKDKFILVQLAYECLSDPKKRDDYDRRMASAPPPGQSPGSRGAQRGFAGNRGRNEKEKEMDAALLRAVQRGDLHMAETLIEAGAWARATNAEGYSALHVAVAINHLPMAMLLVMWGGDVLAKDAEGRTPLHLAAGHGHRDYEDFADILLTSGASTSAVDGMGRTPLHQAALRGFPEVLQRMLTANADVHARDEDGRTALHLGVLSGSQETVRLLLNARANLSVRDKSGFTPLALALSADRMEMAQFLQMRGARD